jgi:hypothetical protein
MDISREKQITPAFFGLEAIKGCELGRILDADV